jgi:hypothetical protein
VIITDSMVVVTQWYVDGEIPPCPRDRDIEETALFLKPFGRPQRHVRGKVTVGGMDDMNRVEFETFR